MSRYNIKTDVVSLLNSLGVFKLVSADYPNDWSKMPSAIYSTKAKPSRLDISMDELLTEWTVKIDLYSNKSLTNIQENVIEQLKNIGFKNVSSDDANTESFKRSILTFRGVVDNRTLLVYQ